MTEHPEHPEHAYARVYARTAAPRTASRTEESVGWWGGNPYENDAACDWAEHLLREGGHLGVVEGALEQALERGLPDAWCQATTFAAVATAALVAARARGEPAPALGDDHSVARLRAWASTLVAGGRTDDGARAESWVRLDRLTAHAAAACALVRAATLDGRHLTRQAADSRAAALAALDAVDEALGLGAAA